MTITSTTTDQAAQLRASILAAERAGEVRNAIEDTLSVFEAEPGAVRALKYLVALLAANAEARAVEEWRERALKAEAALAGGAAASIAEETHTGAGAAPVAGSESPAWANLDALTGDMKQIEVATSNLFSELANITVGADAFDQAAAAMAAESAQKLADAERMAARAAPAPSTIVSSLVVKIDTSAIDAALAKVDKLKAALSSVAPASGFGISAADLGPLETREFAADQVVRS